MPRLISLLSLLLFISTAGFSQNVQNSPHINPRLLENQWDASWIACPDVSRKDYGVFHFRKTISVDGKPDCFVVHASADNRYKLYVNGEWVGEGPSRGDLGHWRFESYDIAELLKQGENVLAAVVWNFGEHVPYAQITSETGFVLQGDSDTESVVNTGDSSGWKVLANEAYGPVTVNTKTMHNFTVIGPGDSVDARIYPWGWREIDFDDSGWEDAEEIAVACPQGIRWMESHWHLVPRMIPQMEHTRQQAPVVRRTEELNDLLEKEISGLTVPANSTVKILLDQSYLTTAYPLLTVSGGRDARIRISYAEALIDSSGSKAHRDSIGGMRLFGYSDEFIADGGRGRLLSTLWWRTFRYLELEIETTGQPLTIDSLSSEFTGYPFERKATFSSDDQSLEEILDVSWLTARLCAGETNFDCPYYEQLNYAGDTRIQSLIALYAAGDGALARKAITLFDNSRMPSGLTQSRYPTYLKQVIPPFSLYWVDMLHDWWMLRGDEDFIGSMLPGVRGVIGWFASRMAPSGMIGELRWWNFVDWADEYGSGVSPGADEGENAVINLEFVYAAQRAARLADRMGLPFEANWYSHLAESVGRATVERCWDSTRGLIAETPEKKIFSQHANVMAVLTGVLPEDQEVAVMERVLTDSTLIQCTYYYRFYLNRALKRVGMGDRYLEQLYPWQDMLDIGLTTFAENPEPTRSDCHAWSASPLYDVLALVVGIEPDAPGFAKVKISPSLGRLQRASCSMPHPKGELRVSLERRGDDGLEAEVFLPPGVSGTFLWNGREQKIVPGGQKVSF
jgi:alpha-L-rhamnosidase